MQWKPLINVVRHVESKNETHHGTRFIPSNDSELLNRKSNNLGLNIDHE
jgi:hypothetical protein